MTKSPRKNVPDVGIELGAACMPSEFASDRATAPGSDGTAVHVNLILNAKECKQLAFAHMLNEYRVTVTQTSNWHRLFLC